MNKERIGHRRRRAMNWFASKPAGPLAQSPSFWSIPSEQLFQILRMSEHGLTGAEAAGRHAELSSALSKPSAEVSDLALFLNQFKSPIILVLLGAAAIAFFLQNPTDTAIIIGIVLVSGMLGFWQERNATRAVERLLAMVQVKADVLRDGKPTAVPLEEVVPGDLVLLRAGDTIPGDCRLVESKALFVDEATLTGETYPVEKLVGLLPPDAPLAQRSNSLFLGTHVVSGTGTAVVVRVGSETEFGQVSRRLKLRPPETEFERGVRRFGYLLMEVTIGLAVSIFAINVFLERPVLESFLFSMALAVGLTPQLLPAIISINLAHGARRMAQRRVIVKRLASIENFGSMTVFCSDKTGTLTEGKVRLHEVLNVEGRHSERVLLHAAVNASLESGFLNPIDEAIRAAHACDLSAYRKLDEEPYDFVRKRLSILAATPTGHVMVTKGALQNVLDVCTMAEMADGRLVKIQHVQDAIMERAQAHSLQGFRILGLAYRNLGEQTRLARTDETEMVFLGLLLFADPPKTESAQTIRQLGELGVSLKILTGDHVLTATHVAREVGLSCRHVITGPELRQMSDEALISRVNDVDVFAEVEPNQKERIILALKKAGHVVGYGGDGINDASALHAADVGVSVDSAVDVAKEAADIVLLEKDLRILTEGVREGRVTFANTLKYVFMATSANFGNMFSMAGAALFLPFLPLLPKQILLTNLFTDIPEMTIATDEVDPELVEQPRRWNIVAIRRFMITFGLVSSVFDYLTFGVLLVLKADVGLFRTGWFVESVISASLIVLVIRTRRFCLESRPSPLLTGATLGVLGGTLLLPYSPIAPAIGFQPLPGIFLLSLAGILALYVGAAEMTKQVFYRRVTL